MNLQKQVIVVVALIAACAICRMDGSETAEMKRRAWPPMKNFDIWEDKSEAKNTHLPAVDMDEQDSQEQPMKVLTQRNSKGKNSEILVTFFGHLIWTFSLEVSIIIFIGFMHI